MTPLAVLIAALAQSSAYEVPEGFVVERAAEAADSFIAMGFDPEGRALLSVESGGLLWLEDQDGDGFFEASGPYTDAISACQGMCWKDGVLFAVGYVDGRLGVHRMTPAADGRSIERTELLAEVSGNPGEHGPHAAVVGPDGALYVTLGDHVRMTAAPQPDSPLVDGYEGSLLPILLDPRGHGHGVVYPGGHVVRIDPETGAWRYHSVGYRNAYDIAFNDVGELFTFDSDMEWGVGLPWYRPVRFLHCVPGGDYGWRKASGAWPDYYPDSLPAIVDVGRGSPTGVAFYRGDSFPARYRGALFAADWSEGRILALHVTEQGATYTGTFEQVVSSDEGLPVTDLEFGPGGALYFTTGGRGTIGKLERLVFTGEPGEAATRGAIRPAVWMDVPDPAALRSTDPFALRRACESFQQADALTDEVEAALLGCLSNADRWVRYAAWRTLRERGSSEDWVTLLMRVGIGAADPNRPPDADGMLGVLRSFQVMELTRPLPGERGETGETGERPFAEDDIGTIPGSFLHNEDWRVAREAAVLLAYYGRPGVIDQLASELEATDDRAQAIHFAYCLSAVEEGWTLELGRRVFRWFDTAETWTGGLSFPGYLAAMRDRVASRYSAEQKLELALKAPPKQRLGLRTVVDFIGELEVESADQLVPALQYAWGGADEANREAALRALPGLASPRLAAFLRRQVENPDAPRDLALIALARIGLEEDYALFLDGVGARSLEVAEASARALLAIDRRPERPEPFRTALDLARRHGSSRGFVFLQLFAHWAAEPVPLSAPPDWGGELAGWERWGVARFREFRAPDEEDVRRPRWSLEAVSAFLEASRERPARAALGADVFQRATCGTCHVVGSYAGPLVGFGPDLTGVFSRFSEREVLEAIWFPSEAIPDLYQTTVIEFDDGTRIEGREVARDNLVLRVLMSDGTELELDRAEIVDMTPSRLSFMPEGLTLPLTLEEMRDLLAYLRADGETDGDVADAGGEWTALFDEDGRNLWEGDLERWKIRGGVLVGRSKGLEQNAYLVSKVEWGDFELELDVRVTDGVGNSGIQYRSAQGQGPDPLGYQADVGEASWGALYATDGRGVLAAPEAGLRRELVDRDGWNHVYLRVQGDRHVVELNGRVTVDVRDAEHGRGLLGFQLHQGGPMEVRFANARIRPLD